MTNNNLTPDIQIFADWREKYGTLSSIQNFFNSHDVDDITALELVFNETQPHSMRAMEGYEDRSVFYILLGLLEHHKNVQAMKQEMMII